MKKPIHQMRGFIFIFGLTCLGFGTAANATTDNSTMTQGTNILPSGFMEYGFRTSLIGVPIGSMSPLTLTGGKKWSAFYDEVAFWGELDISGFTSNPGQSWLTSVKAGSVTKTGASATYTYFSNGVARWRWTGSFFGFNGVGTKACQIIHN